MVQRQSMFRQKGSKTKHGALIELGGPKKSSTKNEAIMMMRPMILAAIMLCIYLGLARAQNAPTACPANYTCSYQSSSTQALLGASTDGQPQSRVGFLTFDSSGNWSGVLSGNLNGTVVANTAVSGTCVSGSDTTLGQLNFKAGLGGKPAGFAFVTAPNGTHTDLIIAGSMLTTDTRVQVAVCHGN